MAFRKVGIIALSGCLTLSLAPFSSAQQTAPQQGNPQRNEQRQDDTRQNQNRNTDANRTDTASKDDIRKAQQVLHDRGMYKGTVNGENSPEWQQALREFQTANKLQATGTLNQETMMALGIGTTQRSQGQATQKSAQTQATDRQSGSSMSGRHSKQQITQVQNALQQKGIDPGPVDGIMGPKTRKAITEFQRQENLSASGELNQETLSALGVTAQAAQESSSDTLAMRQKPAQTQSDTQTRSDAQQRSTQDRSSDTANADVDSDLQERANKAAEVLTELSGIEEDGIPQDLLSRAEAIAVIPGVIKGALGFGGRYGKGLVSQRVGNQWSAPAFIKIGGGSWGAQIGVSSTDLVLVFTDRDAFKNLVDGKSVKLGADASVAAGPIGRSAEAGVDWKLESGVFAYSRAKGLFAGIALDGAVIDMDGDANREVYGENSTPDKILAMTTTPAQLKPFVDALTKAAGSKKVTTK